MSDDEDSFIEVVKRDGALYLSRDPFPDVSSFVALEAPGTVILMPEGRARSVDEGPAAVAELRVNPADDRRTVDRDTRLREAFSELAGTIGDAEWTRSRQPYSDLVSALSTIANDGATAEVVRGAIERVPGVVHATEMVFTAIAMSARADWRAVPEPSRGVAARGWFLGRWIPTFLVLDGPVQRLLARLNHPSFAAHETAAQVLRDVRRFLQERPFVQLRHAIAHWSFEWISNNGDFQIAALDDEGRREVVVRRTHIDAFHIITFSIIEALDRAIVRPRRDHGVGSGPGTSVG